MTAVIAIPELTGFVSEQQATEMLLRPVAGVPLLMRTALTAVRAGASQVLLICPVTLSERLLQRLVAELTQRGVQVTALRVDKFNPRPWSGWVILKPYLEKHFVWLPWNWVTTKQLLVQLPLVKLEFVDWSKPAFTRLEADREIASKISPRRRAGGIAVISPDTVVAAERFLVAHSGKATDGIHSSFNRRLCRPFVRMLSHTPVTPNAVTFGGVLVSILSAIAFAHGTYWWSVLGALCFFMAGLFDEMDGMLARLKFAESPRGTYLEGFADGLSYLLLFAGITIGMYRHYGRVATVIGIALLVGAILALVTTTLQRKRATTPDRPNEYLGNFYQLLEEDSRNWISRIVRQVQGFQRRPLLIHYIVLFTILGLLPLVFCLATIGSNLTWILTLYFNRRFFMEPRTDVKPIASTFKEAL